MAPDSKDDELKKPPLDYSFLKGFAAGVLFSHINKTLVLGLIAGTLTGAYIQQNYQGIPNVEEMSRRFVQSARDAVSKKKPWVLESGREANSEAISPTWVRKVGLREVESQWRKRSEIGDISIATEQYNSHFKSHQQVTTEFWLIDEV